MAGVRWVAIAAVMLLGCAAAPVGRERPLGTLREQWSLEQAWLRDRLETRLPALMRARGVDMWIVPMREYAEDPVFHALVSAETFSARRRTIYVFFDRGPARGVERLALGGTSQGGLFDVRRSLRETSVAGGGGGHDGVRAELWGDEQWKLLREVVDERAPKAIAIDTSRAFAFADGLTAGEDAAMREALGPRWSAVLQPAEALAVDLLAVRGAAQEASFRRLNELAWQVIEAAFSRATIEPGKTHTSDVVWSMRQRLGDLGLTTWFQPSVEVQRRGASDAQLGDDPVIERGDLLHCDFGVTALRLNTDTQHMGYVLREGETDAPAGLKEALLRSNRLQDLVLAELRAGRTGNEILASSLAAMKAAGLEGSVYSHPIGLHGHGAGPLIGLWDHQEGVSGRGDHRVIPDQWFAVELEVTSPVPEWDGQRVRSGQEEDAIVPAEGNARWAYTRQAAFHLVK